MADVLFSHSYYLRLDPKQWETMKPYPPLATLYAASALREAGYDVGLFDVMFSKSAQEIEDTLKKTTPKYLVIYDDSFNWLTKMCLTNMRHACWEMCKLGKAYGCTVIVSSSDSTDQFEMYLEQGADYIIIGEGEITLNQLIDELESDSPQIDQITGIEYTRPATEIRPPSKKAAIRDLDSLNNPAWDLVDIDLYRSYWIKKHGYFSLNMVTTRGCPYKCNWCAKPIFGRTYNARSAESVVNELGTYINQFKVDHVWFCDDIFGLKPNWVQEFAKGVKETNLRFNYMIQSRVDLILKKDTAEQLSASGCHTVWLGAESGSQKILDAMDKEITVEQIYKTRPLLQKHGVRCAFFLQFGYLGENKEDIEATLKMVFDLLPDEIGVSVSYPLPGTKFYNMVKDDLKEKQNWTDSDDLDLLFKNTYSNNFYRILQRYIHKTLQLKKGFSFKWPYYLITSTYLNSKLKKEWAKHG